MVEILYACELPKSPNYMIQPYLPLCALKCVLLHQWMLCLVSEAFESTLLRFTESGWSQLHLNFISLLLLLNSVNFVALILVYSL